MSEPLGDNATSVSGNHDVLVGGASIESREDRLAAGADDLAGRRSLIASSRNVLVIASASLVTLGLSAIVLAWVGASHSTIIEEQVPYLISGGLLGVALAVVGAIIYFAHWVAVLVREGREQEAARSRDHKELLAALRTLRARETGEEDSNGTAGSTQRGRPLRRAPGRP